MAASVFAPSGIPAIDGPAHAGLARRAVLVDLIPGVAQWRWHQRDRGLVLLGTFAATLVMSAFCWGSLLGWTFLALAFLTHLAASIDVLRQLAFPVFNPVVALSAAGLSLAAGVYLPLALSLFAIASPVRSSELGVGYLINFLAYRTSSPTPGDWVWFRLPDRQDERAGQVLATQGQEVEWTGRRWKVDGSNLAAHPGSLPYFPAGWRFTVPRGHVLVGPESPSMEPCDGSPMMIISQHQILGRAWVRCSPFWERSLL